MSKTDMSKTDMSKTDMSHTNTSNTIPHSSSYLSYIEEYIKALVENVNYTNIPSKINLIFDNGALNAFYAIGIALYIRELPKNNIAVDKVSGCSAGACVGLNFLMNNFSYTETFFEKLTTCLRNTHDLHILPQLIRENVYSLFDNDTSALEPI